MSLLNVIQCGAKILAKDTPQLTHYGWVMVCLLQIKSLIYILPPLWQWCMEYLVMLDNVIMALNCIVFHWTVFNWDSTHYIDGPVQDCSNSSALYILVLHQAINIMMLEFYTKSPLGLNITDPQTLLVKLWPPARFITHLCCISVMCRFGYNDVGQHLMPELQSSSQEGWFSMSDYRR